MLSRIINWLIIFFLFLLPWQTRLIYGSATLNSRPWEYGTLSFYATEILLWLVVILTGARIFGRKEFWKEINSRLSIKKRWPVLLIGVAIAFSGLYFYAVSPVKDVSIQFISRLLGSVCLAVCLAVANLNFKKMALAFWGGALIQGILAVMQFLLQTVYANKWMGTAAHRAFDAGSAVVQTGAERWLRSYGSFGWPNSLGIFLAVALVIGLFLHRGLPKRFWPVFLGGQLFLFAGLLFSFSRGALIAAICGILTYFIVGFVKKENFFAWPGVKQVFAFILLTIAIVAIYFPLFAGRATVSGYLENLSLCERNAQYTIAGRVISILPLAGTGPGLYTYFLAANFPAPMYGSYQPVHNIYLLSLAELGLPWYLLLNISVIWLICEIWKKRPLYLAVIVTLLIAGFFDHYLWSMFTGIALFWAIFGLGLAKGDSTRVAS